MFELKLQTRPDSKMPFAFVPSSSEGMIKKKSKPKDVSKNKV